MIERQIKNGTPFCRKFASLDPAIKIFAALSIAMLLAACGPKEIGQESSADPVNPPDVSGVETLRLPMAGASNTQKWLYWLNRPDVMQNVQNWRKEQYRRAMGLAPDPEDPEYRETPQQRSPFRQ